MSTAIATLTFEVLGMHCGSCAMAVDWELEDIDGVVEAQTSYVGGRTEVRFEPAKVAQSDLIAAIERAGYTARLLEEPMSPSWSG